MELGEEQMSHDGLAIALEGASGVAEVASQERGDGRRAALEDETLGPRQIDADALRLVVLDLNLVLDHPVAGSDQESMAASGETRAGAPLACTTQRLGTTPETQTDIASGLTVPDDADLDGRLDGGQREVDRLADVSLDPDLDLLGDGGELRPGAGRPEHAVDRDEPSSWREAVELGLALYAGSPEARARPSRAQSKQGPGRSRAAAAPPTERHLEVAVDSIRELESQRELPRPASSSKQDEDADRRRGQPEQQADAGRARRETIESRPLRRPGEGVEPDRSLRVRETAEERLPGGDRAAWSSLRSVDTRSVDTADTDTDARRAGSALGERDRARREEAACDRGEDGGSLELHAR